MPVKKAVMRLRKTVAQGSKGRMRSEGRATTRAVKSAWRKAHISNDPSCPAHAAEILR